MPTFSPRRFAAVALTAVAAATGCGHGGSDAPAPKAAAAEKAAPRTVAVTTADVQPWPRTVRVQGSLLAYENAIIGSKLAGRVESVEVDLGSVVKRGHPLVVLDTSELDLRIRLAESQLQQACAAIALKPDDDETQVELENA